MSSRKKYQMLRSRILKVLQSGEKSKMFNLSWIQNRLEEQYRKDLSELGFDFFHYRFREQIRRQLSNLEKEGLVEKNLVFSQTWPTAYWCACVRRNER